MPAWLSRGMATAVIATADLCRGGRSPKKPPSARIIALISVFGRVCRCASPQLLHGAARASTQASLGFTHAAAGSRRGQCPLRLRRVLPQFEPADLRQVDLVRAVGEAERARMG